jgi:hypothetical protein
MIKIIIFGHQSEDSAECTEEESEVHTINDKK